MCCLFGMADYGHHFNGRQKSRMLSILAIECEERGVDATGVAYGQNGQNRKVGDTISRRCFTVK